MGPAGKEPLLMLTNASVVSADRTTQPTSLLIEAGRIARVLEAHENLAGAKAIDLAGLTLFPGFVDLHIHGAIGIDVMTADASGLRRLSEFLACQGISSWLPTLVPASVGEYEHAVKAVQAAMFETSGHSETPCARILGVHYEGPFVNSEQCGALHREHFRTFKSAADLDSLPVIKTAGAVHMMTVAPEIEGGIELIRELQQRGWVVSIGHTRAGPEVLDQARDAGAHHMTHFMNAMSPLHHRAPGPIGWGLLNDDVSVDVIADGTHIDPMMLKVLLRCVTPWRLTLISDAIAATGLGDGDYEIWGETISVKDGRTRNAHGSIAGSVITVLDAVRMMLSLGASENDVARMASLNPARLLGIERDCGSIEEGKRADLVALDAQGQVHATMIGGQDGHSRQDGQDRQK
jgi:N-acetylglucosamine-6-phosphate deacetylase